MPEEKDKPKKHMFSGFFDNCRAMYEDTSDNSKESISDDISGEVAKLKLKKIKEIIKA